MLAHLKSLKVLIWVPVAQGTREDVHSQRLWRSQIHSILLRKWTAKQMDGFAECLRKDCQFGFKIWRQACLSHDQICHWDFYLILNLFCQMGWDGDGIDCWYWCRHRSKDCKKAHHLPSQASTFWVGRVIPMNNLHHGRVCTDVENHKLKIRSLKLCRLQNAKVENHKQSNNNKRH